MLRNSSQVNPLTRHQLLLMSQPLFRYFLLSRTPKSPLFALRVRLFFPSHQLQGISRSGAVNIHKHLRSNKCNRISSDVAPYSIGKRALSLQTLRKSTLWSRGSRWHCTSASAGGSSSETRQSQQQSEEEQKQDIEEEVVIAPQTLPCHRHAQACAYLFWFLVLFFFFFLYSPLSS